MSRHRHRVLLYILCCALAATGAARAASVPTATKTATPLPPGGDKAIAGVIADNVKKLQGAVGTPENPKGDETALKQARAGLIGESDTQGGGATAAYQAAYIQALIPAIQPLLSDKDRQIPLNAAIVAGGVAQAVERNDVADLLVPLVKAMLQSKDPAVQYWGMKTAKYALLATAIKNNKDGGLGAMIVDAVKKAPDPSLLIDEAYYALTFDALRGPQAVAPRNQGTLAPVTLPSILDLLEWRVGLYKAGTPPGSPDADSIATAFLPVTAWGAVKANPQTQNRTLKVVGELTLAQLNEVKKAGGSADGDIVSAAKNSGSAIGAFGTKLTNPGLETAGTTISRTIAPNTPPERIDTMIKGVTDGLQAANVAGLNP